MSLVLQEHVVNNEVTKGGFRKVGRDQVTVGPTRLIWTYDFTVTQENFWEEKAMGKSQEVPIGMD